MAGRGFLDVARDVVAGTTEYHWRATCIHAYYALILECRDALLRWGFRIPPRENMHSWVRLRFIYAGDPDLKQIGDTIEDLVHFRNTANYDLRRLVAFSTNRITHEKLQDSEGTLSLLDAIEGDPSRRANAIASIRP